MAQKPQILIYNEAYNTAINMVNHFISEGLPVHEMHQIMSTISADLLKLVEQESEKALKEYQAALEAENANVEYRVEDEIVENN